MSSLILLCTSDEHGYRILLTVTLITWIGGGKIQRTDPDLNILTSTPRQNMLALNHLT